ncbi:hypothetical protein BDV41DRAFT_549283 [Aspergillus transmontanensis]|uniref:Uncharacterized protein n=1 Tax=Aspergillus transmontanensis TaxID=1034304 RepID=A0A5N6VKT2_9EURO|nr:hypothetical protein BDV41DRAFT_549283 [Aspergillus transmontanensis]
MHAPVLCRSLSTSRHLPFPFPLLAESGCMRFMRFTPPFISLGDIWNSRSLAIHPIAMPHHSRSSFP